jgi:acyl carrier protein
MAIDAATVEAEVRRLLEQRCGLVVTGESDALALGAGGLGLDSVALVELVLDCEARFGRPLPLELLSTAEPLTAGELVRRIGAAVTG